MSKWHWYKCEPGWILSLNNLNMRMMLLRLVIKAMQQKLKSPCFANSVRTYKDLWPLLSLFYESLSENQSCILVSVIMYWKIREWQELFLVYVNYLYKIDFLPFFTRTEEIERSSQLRTRAMREAEKRPSKTYRFTLIRVRFPDGYILQGTCKYTACKSTRFYAF